MRVLILTYGSEGDTRPLAALGHALVQAGHQAHLLADAATLGSARALGLPCTALAGDIHAAMSAEGSMRRIEANLSRLTIAHSAQWLQQALALGAGCDLLLVSGLAAFVGLSAAEALGVPAVGAMLIPISPTARFASPFLPFTPPRLFNRASHLLFGHASWRLFRAATNRARAQAGLPPRQRPWTDQPMLYGISPSLLPSPPDWPGNAHLTGQWLAPAPPGWSPPPALLQFLEAGEPPVYVGFGSMGGFDTARVREAVVHAVGGRRAVFHRGWSGIDPASLPPNFHPIDPLPHQWLLPRCAAAIHHGGSGTTHTVARAGVPAVVLPFAGDQFFWAARLRRLGIMRHRLAARSVRPGALAAALDHALRAEVRARAAALGERMRAEDGLGAAVALLRRYAGA